MSPSGWDIATNPPTGLPTNLSRFNPSGQGVRVFDGVMSVALADPLVAPTVGASATAANANMPAGAYTIAFSYTNPAGESLLSPASGGITTTGPNPSILVTLPAVIPLGCTGAKIYVVTGPAGTVGYTGVTLTSDGNTGSSYTAVTVSATPNSAAAPVSNTTGSVAANVLGSATGLFTASMVGMRALVVGVGDAVYGGSLLTTVATFTNSTHLVLADPAVLSSNRAAVYICSDAMIAADTAALLAAIASVSNGGAVVIPRTPNGRNGFYACNAELNGLQGIALLGEDKQTPCILDMATAGFNDVQSPTVALNAAAANANMPAGTYTIGVTYVTARGETALNAGTPASAPTTTTGPNPSILVTFGAIPAGVTQVKIWIITGPAGTVGYTGVFATSGTSIVLSQAGGLVTAAAIAGGGTGYNAGDTLTVVGGTGTAATIKVQQVSAGVITAVGVASGGNYSVAPSNPVSVTGGAGATATFNLTLAPAATSLPVMNTTQLLVRAGPSGKWTALRDLQLVAGKTTTALLRVQDGSNVSGDRLVLDGGANPFQVDCFTMTNQTAGSGGSYYNSFDSVLAIAGRIGFNLRSLGTSDFVNNNLMKMCSAQYCRDAGWYDYQIAGLVKDSCEAEQNGKLYYTSLGAQATTSGTGWGVGVRLYGSARVQMPDIWIEGNGKGTVYFDNRQDGIIIWPSALSQYAQDGGGNGVNTYGGTSIAFALGRGAEFEDTSTTPEVISTSRRRQMYSDAGVLLIQEGTVAQGYLNGAFPSTTGSAASSTAFAGTVAGDAQTRFVTRADGQMNWGSGAATRDVGFLRKGAGVVGTDKSLAHGTQAVTLNGGTVNIDLSLGGYILATISASTTITVSNRQTGQMITLKVIHDGTASAFVITRPATWKVAGGAFTLTNTANSVDVLKMEDDGTNFFEVGRALAVA